ncbi:putative amidase [Mycobacterium xenopi 4042]|uniref:Putative amidase n=1 Tax=Mycobacterium xenopi 4042 TaxID=1299334 RepID=X8AQI2_MYCXE|nr:putative amidase [Mycobacterium xenopi 4042]
MTVSDYVGTAPGPLKIAVSTLFPFTGFRATLHPEIKAALDSVAEQLRLLGHTVMTGNPDYGVRLSVNFLSRSTAGLLDWAERLGDGVDYDRRTLSNMRMGRLLSGRCCVARAPTKPRISAESARFSISSTWCWPRPPPSRRRRYTPSTTWVAWPPTGP